jgi:hypothetical protein
MGMNRIRLEKTTYDTYGNILTMQRNGLINPSNAGSYTAANYGMIDNMSYTYNTKRQLEKILENSNTDRGYKTLSNNVPYIYDANGNARNMQDRFLAQIDYNHLNLPMRFRFFSPSRYIYLSYDASGNKLYKSLGDGTSTIYYCDGAEFENGVLKRIATEEGYIEPQVEVAGTFQDANDNGFVESSEVVQRNHYYPFGIDI